MKSSYCASKVIFTVAVLICFGNGYKIPSKEWSDVRDPKTPWKDCGSVAGKVNNVVAAGCEASPCQLHKGTNVSFEIDFSPSDADADVTAVVHGIIGVVPVPFKIDHPNACENQGLDCPIAAGSQQKYKTTLPVLSSYPSLRVIVKWELQDASKKDIACVEVPVQIVS